MSDQQPPQQPYGQPPHDQPPFTHQPYGQPARQPAQPPQPVAYPPQAYPPGYPPYRPPVPRQDNTLRTVLIVLGVLVVLSLGGCAAVLVGTAAVFDRAAEQVEAADSRPGGPENPLTVAEGEAFEVDGFAYQAGWRIVADGYAEGWTVRGLRLENNREDGDSAYVDLKLWRGNEVLATATCSTGPLALGTVERVDCFSPDELPATYDKVTVNDVF